MDALYILNVKHWDGLYQGLRIQSTLDVGRFTERMQINCAWYPHGPCIATVLCAQLDCSHSVNHTMFPVL